MTGSSAWAATLLLSAAAAGAGPAPEVDAQRPNVVRSLVVSGATAYDTQTLWSIVRLREGRPLNRAPEDVAATLETRYHDDGYPAARVTAEWDADSGRLALAVDEGRLAGVTVVGVSGAAAAHALVVADLTAGAVLREADVEAALDRIARASHGAVVAQGEGWDVEPTPEGPRLALRLAAPAASVHLRLRQPPGYAAYNRVDGVAPWLGVEALVHDRVSYNHLGLYAGGAHGTASGATRFALGARRGFGAGGRVWLGYEFHDLLDTDDVFRGPGLQETARTLLLRESFRDYYRRRGHEAWAFVRWGDGRGHLGINYRADDYASVTSHADVSLFRHSHTPRPLPPIDPGSMRSLVATLRWSSLGTLFDDARGEVASFLLPSSYRAADDPLAGVVLEGSVEVAGHGLGGDFEFTRAIGSFRSERPVVGRLSLGSRLLVGVTAGAPPAQRRFALGGRNALPAFELKAFPGQNIVVGTLELTWQTPSPWPAPAVFYDGGAAWGPAGVASGWKNDVGAGLKWPGTGHVVIRSDVSFAVGRKDAKPVVQAGLEARF